MPESNTPLQHSTEFYKRAARNFYFAIPLYALVPLIFWWGFKAAGYPLQDRAFWYGALGWVIALVLRIPVGLLVKNLPSAKQERTIVLSSGPLEEGVRFILLLLTGTAFGWGASLGQGWAAIEVLYTVAVGMAQASLMTRTDEKAVEARAILEERFGGEMTSNPLTGIVERLFASAIHIAAALLIARSLWLVLPMLVVHSLVNYVSVRMAKKPKRVLGMNAVVGTVLFVIALLVWLI